MKPPHTTEWIDDPATSPVAVRMNLRDQMWINRWLGGNRVPLKVAKRWLDEFARSHGKDNTVRILDAGCGGGDLARTLVDECRKMNLSVRVGALDSSPSVISAARSWSTGYPEIDFVRADVLAAPFDDHPFDLIVASHMLHHLDRPQAVELLKVLSGLSRGLIIVHDLKRSPLLAGVFPALARVLGFHPMSRYDGTVSLLRAWEAADLLSMADDANLQDFQVLNSPIRMTLTVS